MKGAICLLLTVLLLTGCAVRQIEEGTYGPGEDGFVTASDYVDRELPPVLHIADPDDSSLAVGADSCDWVYTDEAGRQQKNRMEGLHPMSAEVILGQLTTEAKEIMLIFGDMPDALTVRRWKAAKLGDTSAAGEPVSIYGQSLHLDGGDWIYEVECSWTENETYYGGTARYVFRIMSE